MFFRWCDIYFGAVADIRAPGIPTFPTFAAERRNMLTHMAAVFRSWARQGFTEGQAGHICKPERGGLRSLFPAAPRPCSC